MQPKPHGWPAESPVEHLPEFFLHLPGSSWPPASDGAPVGTAIVGAWSTSRQLTGGNLPGQVRGATGFSVATGAVTFAQPKGAPLSPWGRGNLSLSPGGACALFASHTGPSALSALKLGAFLVAPIEGASTSKYIGLDLEENSVRLRRPFTLNWAYDPKAKALDAAWVLVKIAATNGFVATAPAFSGSVLSAPLDGSGSLSVGSHQIPGTFFWGSWEGMVGLGGGSRMVIEPSTDFPTMNRRSRVVTCTVGGGGARFVFGGVTFDITPEGIWVREGSSLRASAAFPSGVLTRRVSVYLERVDATTLDVHYMADGGAWSIITDVLPFAGLPEWPESSTLIVSTQSNPDDRWVNAVSMRVGNGPSIRPTGGKFYPTARIEATGSVLAGVFDVRDESAWAVAQEIAAATLGAVWITEDGIFTYRGRDSLRGSGSVTETIEALDSLEDVPWRVDPGDIADRVELTYSPSNVLSSSKNAITIWESTDLIRVPSGDTVNIVATLDGSTPQASPFRALWDEEYPASQYSRWAASTTVAGGGERPATHRVKVSVKMLSPSRARISITNRTDGPLWMVDGNGNPCLTLRTGSYITAGEPAVAASGKPAEKAVSPLTLDAKQWVQDANTAQQIVAWVAGQTSKAQASIPQVRVKPDLSRQLGDIVRLTDEHTGLRTKAIITGADQAGDDQSYTQLLTFAVLDPIFADFDRFLIDQEITTFEQLDTWLERERLHTFDDLDNWLIDFGGTI